MKPRNVSNWLTLDFRRAYPTKKRSSSSVELLRTWLLRLWLRWNTRDHQLISGRWVCSCSPCSAVNSLSKVKMIRSFTMPLGLMNFNSQTMSVHLLDFSCKNFSVKSLTSESVREKFSRTPGCRSTVTIWNISMQIKFMALKSQQKI